LNEKLISKSRHSQLDFAVPWLKDIVCELSKPCMPYNALLPYCSRPHIKTLSMILLGCHQIYTSPLYPVLQDGTL